jgi:hypothetical protein
VITGKGSNDPMTLAKVLIIEKASRASKNADIPALCSGKLQAVFQVLLLL